MIGSEKSPNLGRIAAIDVPAVTDVDPAIAHTVLTANSDGVWMDGNEDWTDRIGKVLGKEGDKMAVVVVVVAGQSKYKAIAYTPAAP